VGQQLPIDEAGMKPGVKRSCCSEDLKQLRHGDDKIVENEKTAAVTALSGHEGLQQKRQKTSQGEESEELVRCSAKKSVQVEQGNSKHDYPSVCDECGQSGEISGTSWQQVDEAGLVQCCSQLLELHCPHSFNADSNNNTTYPLCVASHRSVPEANTQKSVYGDCQRYATQFTIDLLQAAHSAISTLYQASHESQNSQESPGDAYWSDARVVQQALTAAKHFLLNHERVASLQSLVMQTEAASSWAEKDFKAFSHQGVFPLANAIVVGLLQERKQLKLQTVEEDVDEMAMLLLQINTVLRFCFQRVMEDLQTAQISIHLNQGTERVKVVSEAVRTAVPLWLRLYHDIAHCTGLLNKHHH